MRTLVLLTFLIYLGLSLTARADAPISQLRINYQDDRHSYYSDTKPTKITEILAKQPACVVDSLERTLEAVDTFLADPTIQNAVRGYAQACGTTLSKTPVVIEAGFTDNRRSDNLQVSINVGMPDKRVYSPDEQKHLKIIPGQPEAYSRGTGIQFLESTLSCSNGGCTVETHDHWNAQSTAMQILNSAQKCAEYSSAANAPAVKIDVPNINGLEDLRKRFQTTADAAAADKSSQSLYKLILTDGYTGHPGSVDTILLNLERRPCLITHLDRLLVDIDQRLADPIVQSSFASFKRACKPALKNPPFAIALAVSMDGDASHYSYTNAGYSAELKVAYQDKPGAGGNRVAHDRSLYGSGEEQASVADRMRDMESTFVRAQVINYGQQCTGDERSVGNVYAIASQFSRLAYECTESVNSPAIYGAVIHSAQMVAAPNDPVPHALNTIEARLRGQAVAGSTPLAPDCADDDHRAACWR